MIKTTPALVLALASSLLLSATLPAAVYVAIDFVSLWGKPPSDHWELYRTAKFGPAVLVVALLHAVVLGLPVALAMRHRHPMTLQLCIGCGFLIGAVPWFILAQLSNFAGSASIGGHDLSVNHIPTLYGIWTATLFAVGMGCLGALGGLAFWGILRLSGIAASGDFAVSSPQIWFHAGLCLLLALVLATPVWNLPNYFEIRSCHNLFRDGRNSISPVAILNVDLAQHDWSRLRAIFAQIASRHRMSLWDDSWDSRGANILNLSLCNENGTNIEVEDQNWAGRRATYRGVYVSVYKTRADPRFATIAGDFVQSLAASWPRRIAVQNKEGKLVSPAEFLRTEKEPDMKFLQKLVD